MRYMITKYFRRLALLVWLMSTLTGVAQEVSFSATAPKVVRNGEQFRLTYTISGDFSQFSAPSMDPFRVLSGPNQSRSSNFEFRNGKTTTSTTTTYTYWLQAVETGSFTIGPASIQVSRKQSMQSDPVEIQVVAGKASQGTRQPAAAPSRHATSSASRPANQDVGEIGDESLFVRTEASKNKVYIGEQLVVSQKVYTKVNLAGFGDISFPNYSGFWAQEVDIPDRINLERVALNNQVYAMGELKRTVLFPQKSGKLTLEPSKVEVIAQVQRSQQSRRSTGDPFFDSFFNDPFFNSRTANVPVNCVSEPVTITVLPLPEAGKPASFGGAVGKFSISSEIDKTTLNVNEAITIKYRVSGSGNLHLIDLHEFRFPHDFEVYDPKVNRNITTTANSVTGAVTFEYVMIPRNAGVFTIQPVELAYFDPAGERYVTLRTETYEITVHKNPTPDSDAMVYSGLSREEVKLLGEDIRYIKTGVSGFYHPDASYFGTRAWYKWLVLIIIIFLFLFILFSVRRKNRADMAGMKNRKATKFAKRRLAQAATYLKANQIESFYEEVSDALWGYVGDKLNIPFSVLNTEQVKEKLASSTVPDMVIERFLSLVAQCDYARFSPGDLGSGMQAVYSDAVQIITQLEKYLKKAA